MFTPPDVIYGLAAIVPGKDVAPDVLDLSAFGPLLTH